MDGKKNYIRLKCMLIPRATNLLRKIFYDKWEILNPKWINSAEQGLTFISGSGHSLHSLVSKRKQELLHSGNVNVWDLKLLTMVLLKVDVCGSMVMKPHDVSNLTQIMNVNKEIRLISQCFIESEKFDNIWDHLTGLMVAFGDSSVTLAEMKSTENLDEWEKFCDEDDVDIINVLRAKGFKEVANAFYKAGKYTEAIESYSEGINLSCLTKEDLGTLYSNRAAVYMVAAETKMLAEASALMLAKFDAKRALELRPLWFRAHYRLGCAYRCMLKYQKAIIHFEIAVFLDPKHQEITEEMTECKLKLQEEKFSHNVYPEKLPENNAQMAEEISRQFGTRMSEDFFKAMEERLMKLGDSRPLVWQAHRYAAGCSVERNYMKAADLYTKASQMGNAEGLYNLAILHREGKGVKMDLKLSLKLLRQAASKSRTLEGARNVGVAEAEFGLGLAYENGWGVNADLAQAVSWYIKASEHGNKHAANTLACFHFYGKGVEKSKEKAVQYWKLAALRHNVVAMQSLANYFMDHEADLDKALHWHRRAIEAGNQHAKSISAAFEAQINNQKNKPKQTGVFNWVQQVLEEKVDMSNEKQDMSNEKINSEDSDTTVPGIAITTSETVPSKEIVYDRKIIHKYALEGSQTAIDLIEAVDHFNNANNLVKHKHAFISVVIPELAKCIRICEKVITWDLNIKKDAIAMVSRALRLLANDESSHLEKDARICFLALQEMPLKETFSFLEVSIDRYPEEVWFCIVLCNLLGMTKENEKGVNATTAALKKFPDNCDLLFTRACHLQALKPSPDYMVRCTQEIIGAFERFLAVAAPDHRKVPQAFYSIALEYLLCSDKKVPGESNLRMIQKYYQKGLEAESLQLPFYLPYACDKKLYLETLSTVNPAVKEKDIQANSGVTWSNESESEIVDTNRGNSSNKLTDPHRIVIIKEHRETIAEVRSATEEGPFLNKMYLTPCQQKIQFDQMQPITLRDMDSSKVMVYEGFALFVSVIEEPLLGFSGIHLIVEDENGDAERMCVYNFPQNEEVHAKLGIGCTMTVLNPYYRIYSDGKAVLQVDDLNTLIFESGQNLSRCSFCGKSGSMQKCGKCLRAVYCSKNCQAKDWKILKHNLVCMHN